MAGSTFPDPIVTERLYRAVMVRIGVYNEPDWDFDWQGMIEPFFVLFDAEGELKFAVGGDGSYVGPEDFVTAFDADGIEIPPVK